ncbi:MAG: hypothetical protein ACRDYD_06855, partial [Acidimicrobiales bacterium]
MAATVVPAGRLYRAPFSVTPMRPSSPASQGDIYALSVRQRSPARPCPVRAGLPERAAEKRPPAKRSAAKGIDSLGTGLADTNAQMTSAVRGAR